MDKILHLCAGPHGLFSAADWDAFSSNAQSAGLDVLDAQIAAPIAQALNRDELLQANQTCEALIAALDGAVSDCVLYCPDLAGDRPATSSKKRVYPRLGRNLSQLQSALGGVRLRVYFHPLPKTTFLDQSYAWHLTHRGRFSSRFDFDKVVKADELWDETLERAQKQFGAEIAILDHTKPVLCAWLETLTQGRLSFESEPVTQAADDAQTRTIFEMFNRGSGSLHAKQVAKSFLDAPVEKPSQPAATSQDWPPANTRPDWLAPALNPLWARVEKRSTAQDQPCLLPQPGTDLSPYRTRLGDAPDSFPEGGRANMDNQKRILAYRFRGLPETCQLLGLAISYLRRNTEHTQRASQIFQQLWADEYPILLAALPTRWLISTFQTFMDHGANDVQRQTGTAAFFMANTLKLYEAERAIEGHAPDAIYPKTAPNTRPGFRGLDRFDLGGTDLMINTNIAMMDLAARDDISGRVVQEFYLRMKRANTAFSRMDQSRAHHGVDIPQFANCWSFADPFKK